MNLINFLLTQLTHFQLFQPNCWTGSPMQTQRKHPGRGKVTKRKEMNPVEDSNMPFFLLHGESTYIFPNIITFLVFNEYNFNSRNTI